MRKQIGKIRNESEARRHRRRLSIRTIVSGDSSRPRLCAIRTNKHITVQAIDDVAQVTLFSVQTYGKNAVAVGQDNKEGAKILGEKIAHKLKEKNISQAVFDRAGRKYTGVLQTLVDAVRENGIQI